MHYLWMIVIGFVIGAIAKALMPGKDPGGFLLTSIIGMVGALIAGFMGHALGWYGEGEPVGFIASVLGAILLLWAYRIFSGGGRPV
jgi:uncharacterized membrane protein YeaQ/YmgE (transglycosylase-associated protein family)